MHGLLQWSSRFAQLMHGTHALFLSLAALMLGGAPAFWNAPPAGGNCAGLRINEIDYDQQGTDTREFVEIKGPSGVSLGTHELHFVNGGSGAVYRTQSFTETVPTDGYLVVGAMGVSNLDVVLGTGGSNLIQNGAPDGVGIWDVGAGAFCDFVNYEGQVAGFESWPNAGQDSPTPCTTGSPGSLAQRESTALPGAWVEGACATPGEPNAGPTGIVLESFNAAAQHARAGPAAGLALLMLGVVMLVLTWKRRLSRRV